VSAAAQHAASADHVPPRPTSPSWLQPLLYLAASRLAASGAMVCEFKAHAGPDDEVTFIARLQLDPMSACAQLYVTHKASGVCVCQGQPATLDSLDPHAWDTDTRSGLEERAAELGHPPRQAAWGPCEGRAA